MVSSIGFKWKLRKRMGQPGRPIVARIVAECLADDAPNSNYQLATNLTPSGGQTREFPLQLGRIQGAAGPGWGLRHHTIRIGGSARLAGGCRGFAKVVRPPGGSPSRAVHQIPWPRFLKKTAVRVEPVLNAPVPGGFESGSTLTT